MSIYVGSDVCTRNDPELNVPRCHFSLVVSTCVFLLFLSAIVFSVQLGMSQVLSWTNSNNAYPSGVPGKKRRYDSVFPMHCQ